MLRNATLKEISDGRLYGLNDMVKADCRDCVGCHKCCSSDMGNSIQLDPYDVFLLTLATNKSFHDMLENEIALSVVDGIILPHLNMEGEKIGCRFLNEEGRCSIHPYRPSICRLFPLGRYYENGDFKYFLQTNQCEMKNRTKVKVSKWIDIPFIEENTEFVRKWHNFVKYAEKKVSEATDEKQKKNFMLFLIDLFYVVEYDRKGDFYTEFYKRLKTALREMKKILR